MTKELLLDLPVLLPDALDRRDQCIERLTAVLSDTPGLDEVHVVDGVDGAPARLCLHYDAAVVSVARIRTVAETTGANLTEMFRHVLWPVTGINHVRKARAVAESLRRLDGVAEAEVAPGLVRVEFDVTKVQESRLRKVLGDNDVIVAEAGGGASDAGADAAAEHAHSGPFGERSELIFAATAAVLWGLGLALETLTSAGDGIVTATFVVSAIFGGYFTLREAIENVSHRRLEIDSLMLVAAAGAAALGKWEEGALLLALFSLGHALEGYAMGRARRAIEALAELAPAVAIVRDADGEREVPVEDLRVGDVVVAKPNERIPADGFVLDGISPVNQAPLTGESIPVDKQPVTDPVAAAADPERVPATSRVFSGTINGGGSLEVQVTRMAADSSLSKLVTLVREAETQASPTQRFTDRFERIFVPAVIVLVVLVLVGGVLLGQSWSAAFYRAMAVLVAASPCALAIATPSAVLAAVARAGQIGVLVKGGGPLEHLGTLRAVAFDKTGTLTEGRPRLTDVVANEGVDDVQLLSVAVSVEARSDHPLAGAVVRDGTERLAGQDVAAADGVVALSGRGVRGTVGGDTVLIGNAALFEDAGGVEPAVLANAEELTANGRTIMIVKHADRFLGVIGVMDTLRPGAGDAVRSLRAVGIDRTVMLSGDHQLVADSIARQVGLTEAWGDLMPEDKVTAIERLQADEGQVAMVGDGVNDAPALAHATVGIAMGAAGSDVALETADIALMGDDLTKLPTVIGLSRKASRTIRQNLYISLGMVAVLIPATLAGVVGIGPAVVFHEGSTLVVVANALRLLAYRGPARTGQPAQST